MTSENEHKPRTSQWTTASWMFALVAFIACVVQVVLVLGDHLTRDSALCGLAILVSPLCGIIAGHIASYRIKKSGIRPSRSALLLNYFFAVPTMWLTISLARVSIAQSIWVANAIKELDQCADQPTSLVQSLESNRQVSMPINFIVFSNGWAAFDYNTTHGSSAIGDVALLRTSDGAVYISHHHFCCGISELTLLCETRPKDFDEFLTLCETEQRMSTLRWKKIRDATPSMMSERRLAAPLLQKTTDAASVNANAPHGLK